MSIKNVEIQKKDAGGTLTTLYPQTSAEQVLYDDGTVKDALDNIGTTIGDEVSGIEADLTNHKNNASVHTSDAEKQAINNAVDGLSTDVSDLTSKVDGLQGAYIFRGNIAEALTESNATTKLNAWVQTNLSRPPELSDVVIDSKNVEWYFDGSSWNNLGQALVGAATNNTLGLIQGHVLVAGELSYSKPTIINGGILKGLHAGIIQNGILPVGRGGTGVANLGGDVGEVLISGMGDDGPRIEGRPITELLSGVVIDKAKQLETARTITVAINSGVGSNGTGQTSFNGTANAAITVALPNSGVAAGTYSALAVNAKGIVTGGAQIVEYGTTGQTEPSGDLAIGGLFFKEI